MLSSRRAVVWRRRSSADADETAQVYHVVTGLPSARQVMGGFRRARLLGGVMATATLDPTAAAPMVLDSTFTSNEAPAGSAIVGFHQAARAHGSGGKRATASGDRHRTVCGSAHLE